MREKLVEILAKFESIEQQLMDPATSSQPAELQRLGKARAEIEGMVSTIRQHQKAEQDLREAETLLGDPEMKEMAQEEIPQLKTKIETLAEELRLLLIPKDPDDQKSVIVEIRPAAGGNEAGLFASELLRMYLRYAERRRWKTEVIDMEEDGMGALSRVTFSIDGTGAYSQLKFESGVHRVQRVPATESSGRTHTSTVTVAVLPEVEEVDLVIKADDLEISTFRSSSAGGQHMQKNETAIRIVHKPSGIAVTCQDERSQQQNKLQAMSVLRAKLYEIERDRLAKERGELRRGQIGSGDRSEKIRTYNFNQSRITDHRIGKDLHNLIAFMDGDLQPMIDALIQDDQMRKLTQGDEEQ